MPHKERTLEKKTRILIDMYRSATDTGKRSGLQDDLTTIVAEQFSVRQSARQGELDKLEKELGRLKELHARRQNQQDSIARGNELFQAVDLMGDDFLEETKQVKFGYAIAWPWKWKWNKENLDA